MPREKHTDSIGGYAQGMNLSQEGLRHYERKGVIHPERDPVSGYRYYSLKDTIAIAFCRKFRTCGFGLDESVSLLHEEDIGERARMFDEQTAVLEEEIRRQTLLLEHLKQRRRNVDDLRASVGRFDIIGMPPLCGIYTRVNQETTKSREAMELIQSWNKCQPYPDIVTVTPAETLTGERNESATGLVMSPELTEKLGLSSTFEVPASRCLRTAVMTNWESFQNGSFLKGTAEALRDRGLTPLGNTITRIAFVTMPDEERCELLCEIRTPV